MEFGFLWKKELQSLLEQNLSYREIARRLHVDTNTVIKYERFLNSECIQIKKTSNQNKGEDVKSQRQEWLLLMKENPNLSKTELRKLKPSTYIFLYRHDKDWLHENSPKRLRVKVENNRVNWQERDQEILQRVQKAKEGLLNMKGKLKRITVKSLGDIIGERALLEKHLDRLPKTKIFIEQVQETDQDFRLRRVKQVMKEMISEGKLIKAWEVLRKAGIKSKFYNEVIELFYEQ